MSTLSGLAQTHLFILETLLAETLQGTQPPHGRKEKAYPPFPSWTRGQTTFPRLP